MFRVWAAAAASCILAGCASSSSEIKAAYVSPLQYQNLNCQQIGQEMERVSRRAAEASGVQDAQKSQDGWVTAGAIILFWPAAFFIKGDGQNAAELARLKGEFEALEKMGIERNCNLQVRRS
jgi:outer membrane murein-binding lipoprotein Lpp